MSLSSGDLSFSIFRLFIQRSGKDITMVELVGSPPEERALALLYNGTL